MKKETLKDWVKKWSVKQLVGSAISEGMKFQAMNCATIDEEEQLLELHRNKRILINEINRRIKLAKQ